MGTDTQAIAPPPPPPTPPAAQPVRLGPRGPLKKPGSELNEDSASISGDPVPNDKAETPKSQAEQLYMALQRLFGGSLVAHYIGSEDKDIMAWLQKMIADNNGIIPIDDKFMKELMGYANLENRTIGPDNCTKKAIDAIFGNQDGVLGGKADSVTVAVLLSRINQTSDFIAAQRTSGNNISVRYLLSLKDFRFSDSQSGTAFVKQLDFHALYTKPESRHRLEECLNNAGRIYYEKHPSEYQKVADFIKKIKDGNTVNNSDMNDEFYKWLYLSYEAEFESTKTGLDVKFDVKEEEWTPEVKDKYLNGIFLSFVEDNAFVPKDTKITKELILGYKPPVKPIIDIPKGSLPVPKPTVSSIS